MTVLLHFLRYISMKKLYSLLMVMVLSSTASANNQDVDTKEPRSESYREVVVIQVQRGLDIIIDHEGYHNLENHPLFAELDAVDKRRVRRLHNREWAKHD